MNYVDIVSKIDTHFVLRNKAGEEFLRTEFDLLADWMALVYTVTNAVMVGNRRIFCTTDIEYKNCTPIRYIKVDDLDLVDVLYSNLIAEQGMTVFDLTDFCLGDYDTIDKIKSIVRPVVESYKLETKYICKLIVGDITSELIDYAMSLALKNLDIPVFCVNTKIMVGLFGGDNRDAFVMERYRI